MVEHVAGIGGALATETTVSYRTESSTEPWWSTGSTGSTESTEYFTESTSYATGSTETYGTGSSTEWMTETTITETSKYRQPSSQ